MTHRLSTVRSVHHEQEAKFYFPVWQTWKTFHHLKCCSVFCFINFSQLASQETIQVCTAPSSHHCIQPQTGIYEKYFSIKASMLGQLTNWTYHDDYSNKQIGENEVAQENKDHSKPLAVGSFVQVFLDFCPTVHLDRTIYKL